MLTQRTNFHHSKIPPIGAIVRIHGLERHYYSPRDRWQVVAYPLNDNVGPWSRGIYTCHIKRLRDGRAARVSGFYLNSEV